MGELIFLGKKTYTCPFCERDLFGQIDTTYIKLRTVLATMTLEEQKLRYFKIERKIWPEGNITASRSSSYNPSVTWNK